MLQLNQVQYNTDRKTVTAQAGSTWKKVQEVLAKYGRSIKVMQSDNIFTVGGSISVNAHGWQTNSPPIGATVVAMTVITVDGAIKKISLDSEPELFKAVIGGYGLFAIIIDAELTTVKNSKVKFNTHFTSPQFLEGAFKQKIFYNPKAELAYARLSVEAGKLFNEAGLFWYDTQEDISEEPTNFIAPENLIALKRGVFRLSEYGDIGKKFRWQAEKTFTSMLNSTNPTIWRNDAMNTDIHILWPLYGNNKDILQEYFIPEGVLYEFIEKLKSNIKKYEVNILNVTIREIKKDHVSLLPYARQNVFGLVCLFSQKRTNYDEENMQNFTQSVIADALDLGGTFYLPYRQHYKIDQVVKSYPDLRQWLDMKRKYDPNFLLNSQFFNYIATSKD